MQVKPPCHRRLALKGTAPSSCLQIKISPGTQSVCHVPLHKICQQAPQQPPTLPGLCLVDRTPSQCCCITPASPHLLFFRQQQRRCAGHAARHITGAAATATCTLGSASIATCHLQPKPPSFLSKTTVAFNHQLHTASCTALHRSKKGWL